MPRWLPHHPSRRTRTDRNGNCCWDGPIAAHCWGLTLSAGLRQGAANSDRGIAPMQVLENLPDPLVIGHALIDTHLRRIGDFTQLWST